jgi:hypothetical protein
MATSPLLTELMSRLPQKIMGPNSCRDYMINLGAVNATRTSFKNDDIDRQRINWFKGVDCERKELEGR